jgi:hypothetical protein
MDLRQLIITPDFSKLIAKVDEFKGTWKVTQLLSPERLQSLRHIATIESIGSSTAHRGCEAEQEVAGYAQVMDLVFEHSADLPLSKTTSCSSTVNCCGIRARISTI